MTFATCSLREKGTNKGVGGEGRTGTNNTYTDVKGYIW